MPQTGNPSSFRKVPFVRSATSILVVVGLLGVLGACSTPPVEQPDADCTPTASGALSDGVDVSGDFGSKPKVTLDTPAKPEATERTVVIAGDGDTALKGDLVEVNFTMYNGESGDEITATEYSEGGAQEFTVDEKMFLSGLVKTLECSTVGSRVVGVIPAADAFGDQGQPELGVNPGESIVFVADVVAVAEGPEPPLPRADGTDQEPQEGFPTVELDDTGRPTITLPSGEPPADLQLAVLKEGSGEIVQPGSDVVVHYVGLNWNTNEIFDESWERGAPATFNTAQVIPGFTAALEGQKVGSQVIVVIPPDQGYGPQGGNDQAGIGAEDTLVFVVDILGLA